VIGQNYSWGHDVSASSMSMQTQLPSWGRHSRRHKIQDFAPYVAKIKDTGPDTVVTGNWSSDLLLLMKAAGDSGLKVRFATYWMDQPGNVANAGATAIGHFNVSSFYPEANGDATAKFSDDFKAKMGQYPIFIQGQPCAASGGSAGAEEAEADGRQEAQRQAARVRHGDRQLQHQHG
jgi:branched-chain amino acid transport system substrate-binding protein